ncbi:MAG: hypothetical protein RMY35_035405, partial [Nostoc sp. DedSLP01]
MTSCSEISSQLSALSSDISALDGKFITRSDLNRLEQEIAAVKALIKSVNEDVIIQKSVKLSEQSIVPKIDTAVAAGTALLASKLQPQI